ncbi:MAG: glycosyltransferase family 2 protein [Gemmatimonadaceae bacterium]
MVGALPWVVTPIVTALRTRRSQPLNREAGTPPVSPPTVSVVIPARNECRNIERCVKSVLAGNYPAMTVTVVDDQSTDGTGEIARTIARTDSRLKVIETTPLPTGWFGKQWACESGARSSQSEIILFADADTVHSPDLVTRSVNAIERREADLFSVMGRQELGTFWERVIQPQIFNIMLVRYGGTESISRSRSVKDKIANGQCLFVRRDAYESLGGHGLVKSHVADDMMMAQRFFASGRKVIIAEGIDQLSTRMYTSLSELISGWGKNVFAGGRDSVPFGWLGKLAFPLFLLSAPLIGLAPALVLLTSLVVPLPGALVLWAAIAQVSLWLWWFYIYNELGESPLYAIISPIGAGMVFYIFLRATLRGRRVNWKGREYIST